MDPDKLNHHQVSIPKVEQRSLRRPNNVSITMAPDDLRLIRACILIAQEKHAGILTWAQERAASNISAGIQAELNRHY